MHDQPPSLNAVARRARASRKVDPSIEMLRLEVEQNPRNSSCQLALTVALSNAERDSEAILEALRYFSLGASDPAAYDALGHSALRCRDSIPARLHGALDLACKDRAAAAHPATPLADHRHLDGKPRVIAFTLFGSDPRYLRGALHNVIAAKVHYPGWTCRFAIDRSVDDALVDALRREGAEILLDDRSDDDFCLRLARRFLVADDPAVGRFLVRDCDSVVNGRKAAAVAAWVESGKPFHVMRDWWTHSDLMLAGMWGGFANILPAMGAAINAYRATTPPGPNWDQRFLARHVWPSARGHMLIHDRLFDSHAAMRFPTPDPPGVEHVGQNEYVADRAGQATILARFAEQVPALGFTRRSR